MKGINSFYATPVVVVLLRVGGAVASFVISLILARTMEPSDMGHAMVLMSMAVLVGLLASAGIEAGTVRFIAKYREEQELALARGFLWLSRRIVTLLGVTLCVLAVSTLWLIWTRNGTPPDIALVIALVTACFTGFLRVGAAYALAFGKVIRSLAPSTFIRQIFLLGGLLLYVAIIGPPSTVTVISIFLIGNIAAVLIQTIWNYGLSDPVAGEGRDLSAWSVWLRFGLVMAPTLLFVQYSRDLTLIFSAWSLPGADLAVLGVVTAIVAFAKFAVAAVNQSITPKMAAMIAADETPALIALVKTSNHMKIWPMAVIFIGLALFGEMILSVFGQAFSGNSDILLILMIEPLALAVFGPSGQYLSLSGRQNILVPAALVAICVMMLAVSLGGHLFGIHGAAAGVALSWTGWSAGLALYVRRISGHDLTAFRLLRDHFKKR